MKRFRLLAATAAVLVAVVAIKAVQSAPTGYGAVGTAPQNAQLKLPPHSAAIVADARTGRVLYADRPHRRLLIGSTAKLMTALVALERTSLEDSFTAPAYAGDPTESRVGLGTDEQLLVGDLLRGLLVVSGNDAAIALAEGVAGSQEAFVELMNERAQELGMSDTRYGNPIGLDDGTSSSAADLVTLTRELRRHDAFREIVASPSVTLSSGAVARTLENTNDLLGGPLAVDGVKTGHTKAAGYVLVGSATRGGRAVISAVLGTRSEADRDRATMTLLRHGLRRMR
ncbi:D-alanyl-D-alanine carboxypeptidase family protein [Conexibacter woesei]|uniref:Peptidase S11 D-alanyl-D-alanine carboxypeptidase 1 n=1 Tax=Conexibacter woesei (strain DSM 14684 / CCUG 47730 / CIP 108061 / JCM 11494 / NBRC 100937 / ID131577) TaxID=469383 RepID=D3F0N1_CONWI|nr:D-alanyl-D-alanine carboxypeptidase family protein [Conexibacter woesei]ADB53965.1 peptidase S11 D-alanyl-D-alanine carboxypeptidase 1 [Conexibacter woesei DSM 14684]